MVRSTVYTTSARRRHKINCSYYFREPPGAKTRTLSHTTSASLREQNLEVLSHITSASLPVIKQFFSATHHQSDLAFSSDLLKAPNEPMSTGLPVLRWSPCTKKNSRAFPPFHRHNEEKCFRTLAPEGVTAMTAISL